MNIGAYLKRTGGEDIAPSLGVFILAITALFVLVAIIRPGPYAIIGAAGFLFLLLFGWRIETFPVLFLLYLALAPSPYGPGGFESYQVYYYPILAPFFILGMAIIFKLDRSVRFLSDRFDPIADENESSTDIVGIFVLLLVAWLIFQSLRGLALGYNPKIIRYEAAHAIVILGYFVWRTLFKRRNNIRIWLFLLIIIELFTAAQFFALIISKWETIFNFVLSRIITRQGHMTLAATPLILAFLFSAKKWSHRLGWLFAFLIVIVHIIFTQQRVLFLANGISVILIFTLFAFRNGWNRRGLIIWLTGIGGLIILLIGVVAWALMTFNVDIDVIFKRWEQFGSLQDASTMLRVFDIRRAMSLFSTAPILGMGIGKTIMTVPNGYLFFFIDNSYVMALFKGGIPYLMLLVAVYLGGLWCSWKVFRGSSDDKIKLLGAGIFSALIAIMLTGATNVCMIYYRFGYVWMMLIAASVVLYESIPEEKRKTTEWQPE